MNELFVACRSFVNDLLPQTCREVRLDIDDAFAVSAELGRAGEIVFALVFAFAMRGENISAHSKMAFMSKARGLIQRPAFDDEGEPVPAELMARVRQLRGLDRDEIGTLLPTPIAKISIDFSSRSQLHDRLSCFAINSLLQAWATLPSLLHLDTVAKIIDCSQAAKSDATQPEIHLSLAMTELQFQASNGRGMSKH